MVLDEIKISRAIIETYQKKLLAALDVDVAIVGAGPAGMVCAYYLAKEKLKVVVFERKLSIGGGMWGGGIMFNEIVVQKEARDILDNFGVRTAHYQEGYYTADSIEAVSCICAKALQQGARFFNLMSVEDVMVRGKRVCGLVINWTAVQMAGLHVDPITIKAKFVVDATGHAAEVVRIVERKSNILLDTRTGKTLGEQSMWAERAEQIIVKNSRQVAPGLYTCGMCANAVFGGPRMGPIFGGMFLAGKKVAGDILKKI